MGRTKKLRWEENNISPSKCRSPTRNGDSNSRYNQDKDELIWSKTECDLSDSQIDLYLLCTSHLPVDTALSILHGHDYDIKEAVDRCNGIEVMPDLSTIEQKVLLAAVPLPCAGLGVTIESAVSEEKQVLSLLPHTRPSVIRNYYNRIGRDGYVALQGWVPRVGHILKLSHARLVKAGLISEEYDSTLYEKPGRLLRSSILTPVVNLMPRKVGKGNNLAIAMVGFGQNKAWNETPERRLTRALPFKFVRSASSQRRTECGPGEKNQEVERMSREEIPKRKRSRPSKIPAPLSPPPSSPSITAPLRSPLAPSFSPLPLSQIPSSIYSSLNGFPVQVKKREDRKLEINLDWRPDENGIGSDRPSSIMEEMEAVIMKKKKIDSNGDDGPSTSRMPGGSERKSRWGESLISSSLSIGSSTERSATRSSLFTASLDSCDKQFTLPKKPRDNLRIEMVGWHQKLLDSTRDSAGSVLPTLPPPKSQ